MTEDTPDITGMRVLLGPGDTASFPTRLARALAERGARCWVVDFSLHPYSAGPDKLGKAKLWGAAFAGIVSTLIGKGGWAKAFGSLLKTLGQCVVFLWALLRADALVLVSSRSLLPGYLDLPIYRLLGKRVIRVFLGTDSRPRYMTGWHHQAADPSTRDPACRKLAQRVQRQRGRVRFMSRYASLVVDNPLCGHYQQRPYINWFHIGFPHDPAFFETQKDEATNTEPSSKVKVLHCPSNPEVKGTDRIEAVIETLKADGTPIQYTRITGMPHAQVLAHLQSCDLVIDELYSDSPMAGFASEAAAYGRPVIVGGYGWENLRANLGEGFAPNILCQPEALEQTLRDALSDLGRAKAIGQQANAFMNGYWRQDAVADRFAKLLTGQGIHEDWWVDPDRIDYWQGLGATDEHRMTVIKALIATCGIDALGLAPDQAVAQTIRSWAESS